MNAGRVGPSVASELGGLQEMDFDISVIGFGEDEINRLLQDPADIEFPEYDESLADSVEYLECPSCGHKWPK